MDSSCAQLIEYLAGFAGYNQVRRAAVPVGDFDIMPGDAVAPARAESFEKGFFSGPTRCKMLCRNRAASCTIVALAFGENTFGEAR